MYSPRYTLRVQLFQLQAQICTLSHQGEGSHLQSRHAPAAGRDGQQYSRGDSCSLRARGFLVRSQTGSRRDRGRAGWLVWTRVRQRQEEEKGLVINGTHLTPLYVARCSAFSPVMVRDINFQGATLHMYHLVRYRLGSTDTQWEKFFFFSLPFQNGALLHEHIVHSLVMGTCEIRVGYATFKFSYASCLDKAEYQHSQQSHSCKTE